MSAWSPQKQQVGVFDSYPQLVSISKEGVDQRQKGQTGCDRQAQQKVRAECGKKHLQVLKCKEHQNILYFILYLPLTLTQWNQWWLRKITLSENEISWPFLCVSHLFPWTGWCPGEKVVGTTPLSPCTHCRQVLCCMWHACGYHWLDWQHKKLNGQQTWAVVDVDTSSSQSTFDNY